MKKKIIERIPYLQLAKVSRKKEVEYIAVSAIQEIGGEDHLIVEVYRNKKECREIPVARIVITNKDFGTFLTGSRTWTRGRITRNESTRGRKRSQEQKGRGSLPGVRKRGGRN